MHGHGRISDLQNNSLQPLFQSESTCEVFVKNIRFHSYKLLLLKVGL